MTTITALPAAPARTMDAPTFVTTADTFVAALPPMVTQINTVAGEINTASTSALLSAQNAAISQTAAKTSEDNALLYKTTAQSAAAAAQSAAGLPALKAGRVLRSPDGINVEFGNVDGDIVYANKSQQIPLAKTVLANSINGLLELTTPSNPQPGDWFVVADQGNARTNNVVIKRAGGNMFTSPESFDTVSWSKIRCFIGADSIMAPDGTMTADVIGEDTSNSDHYITQVISLTAGIPITFSIYAKANTKSSIELWVSGNAYSDNAARSVSFNLVNGTIIASSSSDTSSKITNVGNGWYRCEATLTPSVTIWAGLLYRMHNGSSSYYQGTSSNLFIWGAKCEIGTSATFYDPVIPIQNLIPFSAPKITGQWSSTRVTAPDNSAIAPDGSMTAVTISEDSNNGTHAIWIGHNPMASTYYTFSIDVAPIGRNWVFLELIFGGIYCICWFDILTGVVGLNSGAQNANISKNAINGYYRISISSPLTINTGNGSFLLYPSTGNGIDAYAGDGRAAIAIANAQLETGIIATPRIATNGAPATRTGNPTKIMGIADDLAIRRNYQNCKMTYQDDLMGWVLR